MTTYVAEYEHEVVAVIEKRGERRWAPLGSYAQRTYRTRKAAVIAAVRQQLDEIQNVSTGYITQRQRTLDAALTHFTEGGQR